MAEQKPITFLGNWINQLTLVPKRPKKVIDEIRKSSITACLPCMQPKPKMPDEVTVHVMLNPEEESYYHSVNSIILGPMHENAAYEFNAINFEGAVLDITEIAEYFVPYMLGKSFEALNKDRSMCMGGQWKTLHESPWGVLMKAEAVPNEIIEDKIREFSRATTCPLYEKDKEMVKCFKFAFLSAKFIKKFFLVLEAEMGDNRPRFNLVVHGAYCTPVLKFLEPANILQKMKKSFVITQTALGTYHPKHLGEVKRQVEELGKQAEHTFERLGAMLCDDVVNASHVPTETIRAQLGVFRVLDNGAPSPK